ncbi:proline permease [Kordiimonas sediminis]|uniref:Sodium/proline symporter n=1 Tax=Kordiimonas sediminis TaxID=1735581 RepID=A0A919ARE8_9PROT|nr:sodium/proline symporter [Kordiimonas sediminis]GHF20830.1 proline permease [Kordiimonas sediminis]
MEEFRQEIILTCVAAYMGLCIWVGIWAMRRTKSAGDFFVAGRGLGPVVISLAVFSSTLSGFGFVGGPGLVYATGMSSVWMTVSTLGYALGFYLVAIRIRMVAEARDTVSLPDVIAARYDSEAARLLTAITILLGVLGYMATQILAMGLVLQSVLSASEMFANISLFTCVVFSSAILIFYCVTGGIIASVYTDLVQGGIMIVAGALVVITAIDVFPGGMAEVSETLLKTDSESIMPFGTLGTMASIAWCFMFGLGLAGQPHVVTKMMMNKSIRDNKVILPITVIGYAIAAMLWISVGVVMRALVLGDVAPPLSSADEAAPVFLSTYAHPLLAGIVFAGLFAAIMSTADGFLNIGAAAIIHDIPRAIRGRSLDRELWWARVATIVLSVIAACFALYSYYYGSKLVAILGTFGWGTFAAALVPVVMFGLNWKGATKAAAITSITFSLIINFSFQVFEITVPYGISPGFIAMLASMILFVGISLLDKRPQIAKDIDRIMDL